MPKKAAQASVADQDAAPGGAAAVDRALSLLACYRAGDAALSLAELAERTQLYKSTVLRLLASLVHARLLQRTADGLYGLGPELARLSAIYTASFSLEAQLMPVMRELVATTQESVSLHVRQGEHRLCLLRVDSPQVLRDHVRAGDILPLDRGAGGRVLLAFTGARGRLYAQIRRDGVVMLSDDRVPGVTGVSAPVWGPAGELVGALTLTLPTQRAQTAFIAAVHDAARAATRCLGGSRAVAR
ncbi:IclR family transcriptional regulator [Aquabacterium sp.]|uniref:IclR family transcriptional regulator n=1 Tax=Aquabacterium sp. TaxID=1872578 RepID=UPI002C4278B5|nr:IclR family transcriptional regulator [Aquabacterium sp.]HSW08313.1 IclR family transcriptional regulator [Aquabacterium sp.]